MKGKLNIFKIRYLVIMLSLLACFVGRVTAQDSTIQVVEDAKITLSFDVEDSIKVIKATLTTAGDEPIKDVDVLFLIKRNFGILPLEGDFTTTDESGVASVDFPTDLPGDKDGNVTVIAKVQDNETIADMETEKAINWGVPAKPQLTRQPRALWASANNAPWPLTITVTGIVVIVWGIILYMVFQLFAIKKAGKLEA